MKPETKSYLEKARIDVDEAQKILTIGLARAAARSAYYAAFHAAEAFIVERTGKIAKSHSGVRSEFARLTKDSQEIDRQFPKFLAQAYMFKEIGDYAIGDGASVTSEAAEAAILTARRFIETVAAILPK